MPIIIKSTDSPVAIASPELDHRIETGSAEYDALLKKVPAVGAAAGSTVLIMPKSDAWKIDPTKNKWKLTLDGETYIRFEDGIKGETTTQIEHLKGFVRERAKQKPKLAERDDLDPVDWSWDSAVDHIGWPDSNNLAVRTKFTNPAFASPQIRSVGATSGCYIGNGFVLTCGHYMRRIYDNANKFMVIFGWNREVDRRYYDRWAIAEIDRIVAWDEFTPDPFQELGTGDDDSPTYLTKPSFEHIKDSARKWDGAIIKLKFDENPPKDLKGLTIAPLPATFDDTLFSMGCPAGSQVKISPDLRVLRYNIDWYNDDLKSQTINEKPMARFTTNMENFGGNSGGPIVDSATGQIVGIVSGTITSSTVAPQDPHNPLKEGNEVMQNLNRHIMDVEGKIYQQDNQKHIPRGKALQQSDLHEILEPWVICQNGDLMPDGHSINNGPAFTYLTILKNQSQYHIDFVRVIVSVPTAAPKEPVLALQSNWGTKNAPITTTSVNVDGDKDIGHHWGTIFRYQLGNIVTEPLVPGAPALPLDLTKSPSGIIDWAAFSVKADPKVNLEGEEFTIDVTYKRAAFGLGRVVYPEEVIPVFNWGTLHKEASADAPYKPTLSYWRTQ